MAIPSSARTSALPEFPDAERLPCLATGTPHEATMTAVAVETLTVLAPSPPVPQVSSRGEARPTSSQVWARSRTASTAPAISSADSPFIRRAVRNAAINASEASPAMIAETAAWTSAAVRSRPVARPASASVRADIKESGRSGARSDPGC